MTHGTYAQLATKCIINFCLVIDIGLIRLVPGLKLLYGITDDPSPATFDRWRNYLVPTRDAYLAIAYVASLTLIVALGTVSLRKKRRLATIEALGLVAGILTVVFLTIAQTSIPRGGMVG